MTPGLDELLRDVPLAAATEARERTVAAARAQLRGRARSRRRTLTAACAAALLAIGLLTPPGRAASGWVGELVGIGEVGGSATLEQRTFGKRGEAIVLDNGVAPDGTRYEWVAYPCSVDLRDEGLATRFDGYGTALEWPGVKGREGGGVCEEARRPRRAPALGSHGVAIVPSQFEGVARPDLVVSGTTGPQVHRLEVVYREPNGERHELPVDFRRIGPAVRGRITASAALGGTFVAFVPGRWAARDEVETRLDLRALQGTDKLELGPIARRERKLVAAVRRRCGTSRRCLEREGPPSPVELVAYDERGREIARRAQPLTIPGPPPALPDGPARRLTHGEDVVGRAVELLEGRAPDGARYEVLAAKLGESEGELVGRCLTTWWPDSRLAGGAGSCGPQLPPKTAFGRRRPERVAARQFGFLTPVPTATRHLMLSGFTRANVARVRVVYRDGAVRRDAPVDLARVDAALADRMAARERFGWFVAFLPRSARDGEIQVIALDEDGRVLSRVPYAD